jgi:hypothetical protein
VGVYLVGPETKKHVLVQGNRIYGGNHQVRVALYLQDITSGVVGSNYLAQYDAESSYSNLGNMVIEPNYLFAD